MEGGPEQEGRSTRGYSWHPLLIAMFPAANMVAKNVGDIELRDVVGPLLAVLALAAVTYWGTRRLTADVPRAAVVATWTLIAFFSFGGLGDLLDGLWRRTFGFSQTPAMGIMVAWCAVWAVGATWILWTACALNSINKFLNVMTVVLLAFVAAECARNWRQQTTSAGVTVAKAWTQPTLTLRKSASAPDIYFLVFDRYAGAETLRRHYQFDNDGFMQQLRDRGFRVVEQARSNYPLTLLSMCSTLNLAYLPDERLRDVDYARLIQNHSVGRSLKRLGYEYHHLGNWFQPLRTNRNADRVLSASMLPSEFADSLYQITPLSRLVPLRDHDRLATSQFQAVAAASQRQQPTFVYAHFLLPHDPYVLDRDGSALPGAASSWDGSPGDYARQLEGTNRLLLRTIDQVLASSEAPPLIVLQADEGPYLTDAVRGLDRREQLRLRSSILSAFLLPARSDGSLPELPETPVNTFRMIFREYFEAEIDLLPERTFFWDNADALGRPGANSERFVDVTGCVVD